MAERPVWEQIGTSFVHLYYQRFDSSRVELSALYVSISLTLMLHNSKEKQFLLFLNLHHKQSLPFQKIQHSITSQDHQPAPDNCILSMVVGQLKVDNDPVMGFHQLFVLKNINDNWVCTNDIFRLALYNFA
uniref:NTF2-related export protein n=1 Tax=Pelusios castaneus TaxID=367368 RepID=A0A8C8RK27_9SAUR